MCMHARRAFVCVHLAQESERPGTSLGLVTVDDEDAEDALDDAACTRLASADPELSASATGSSNTIGAGA